MTQKKIFLDSEGDNWFERNKLKVCKQNYLDEDLISQEIINILGKRAGAKIKVLEIGCGEGSRLAFLKNTLGVQCYGIDPSSKAIDAALSKGLFVKVGTADQIPFPDVEFDIVIFGFCLYLCDREDLFKIAFEADRVLKNPGWLLIMDGEFNYEVQL